MIVALQAICPYIIRTYSDWTAFALLKVQLVSWLQENMGWVLIIGTFVNYCGALIIIGTLYKFWAPHPSCGLNIFFITFTLVLALVFTLISVSPWRLETAGLLTSGVVFLYCAWVLWSALSSEPNSARCTFSGYEKATTAQKVSGLLVVILLQCWERSCNGV